MVMTYLCSQEITKTTIMMKTNYLFKTLLLLLCLVGGVNVSWAAAGDPVTIPTTGGNYIDWSKATLSNCNPEGGGSRIGSTHNGSTATFNLTNSTAQDYYLSFASGANSLTATVSMTISNGSGYTQKEEFDISNTGSWDVYEFHAAKFENVPSGSLTLTFKVESTTGSSTPDSSCTVQIPHIAADRFRY